MKLERQPPIEPSKHEARYRELRERLKDPKRLPSIKELRAIFEYSWNKGDQDDWRNYLGDESKENKTTGKYEFNFTDKVRYEVLTKEHVEGLREYIESRVEEYGAERRKPLKILEVGAGDGRLTHFLRQGASDAIDIKAVDSGVRRIKADFPVSIIHGNRGETYGPAPIRKAIEQYKPDIVISSWMPYEEDWTEEFRDAKSVKEYILIGDGELCGDGWKTWYEKNKSNTPAPYEQDGFTKTRLPGLWKFQACRTDDFPSGPMQHSDTVSFRRTAAQ